MKAFVHPDLELSGTTLKDTVLAIDYILTPDAAWLFRQLSRHPKITDLVAIVVRSKGLSRVDAERSVYMLLGLLDVFGGVHVRGRSVSQWM